MNVWNKSISIVYRMTKTESLGWKNLIAVGCFAVFWNSLWITQQRLYQGAQISGILLPGELHFFTVGPNCFSAIFLPLTYKIVYQLTCTKQKAPDNSEVHRSLQNCWSLVWNLLYVTILAPRICRQLLDFRQNCVCAPGLNAVSIVLTPLANIGPYSSILMGAIPLCCNNIVMFYYCLKTQHILISNMSILLYILGNMIRL